MLCHKILLAVIISLASVASYPANDASNPLLKDLPSGVENWILIPNDRGELQLAILDEPDVQPKANLPQDVKFILYTSLNTAGTTLLVDNPGLLLASNFNPNNPTKILIHGFGGGISSDVIVDSKNAYLSTGAYNVIGVDWGKLCKSPWYSSAKSNSKPVGQYVAKLIDQLVADGQAKLQDIHIIGHSLGSHVAGFAGDSVTSGKVGRVTGLDSAAPLFDTASASGRLDPTDGLLVDSIHTNIGFLGMEAPHAHLDFYPNGGDKQPGCGIDFAGSCSHGKAVEYFVKSIINGGAYPAVECVNLKQAKQGSCTAGGIGNMGESIAYALISATKPKSHPHNVWVDKPKDSKTKIFFKNEKGKPVELVMDKNIASALRSADLSENVRFRLFTSSNPEGFMLKVGDKKRLKQSTYNPNNPTKILIHGFTGYGYEEIGHGGKVVYLRRGEYNIISVHWESLCVFPYYLSSVNNVKKVGIYVAKMIDFLIDETKAVLWDFHIIGHSLGAHVAGLAGANVKAGKIGRITGLDPARPLFELSDTKSRLDPDDAELVDVIHTDVGNLGFGMLSPIGDIDFYPNGGKEMPGCPSGGAVGCNHMKSIDFFLDSVNYECGYEGVECNSVWDAQESKCKGKLKAVMGEFVAYRKCGLYYVPVA